MPGFVNVHTHLAMTVFRGLADDLVLQDWLTKYIFPAEAEFIDAKTVRAGSELAMVEMIHSGTTTFNDMYFYEDETAQAATNIGMRGFVGESLIDFPVPNSANYQKSLEYMDMLLKKYKDSELIKISMAVHSPYTCSAELIKTSKKIADQNNQIYHMHVSETKWEVDSIKKTFKMTPVEYLDNLGVLSNNFVAAHCVWLSPNDIKIMAERKVGIAHNPECNMKISSGIAPIPELLKAKAEVGLGTDGVASNNNMNMIEEMHTMALLHKLSKMDPTAIPAETVIRTATIGSARVLGMQNEIGSLEKGKKADIILIDTDSPNMTPLYNVYSSLVYAASGSDVNTVIINGKIIMKEKKILTIDEQIVKANVNEIAKKIGDKLLKKK